MYVNAEKVLPPRLLEEVQKFVQGREMYVPKKSKHYLAWGERSGARRELRERNEAIFAQFRTGSSCEQLAKEFHLSLDRIKRIIREERQEWPRIKDELEGAQPEL